MDKNAEDIDHTPGSVPLLPLLSLPCEQSAGPKYVSVQPEGF